MVTRRMIFREARKYLGLFSTDEHNLRALRGEDRLRHRKDGLEVFLNDEWVVADPLIVSIAKWIFIAENKICTDFGGSTCGLCVAYRHWERGCLRCPVAIEVEAWDCWYTPFANFSFHLTQRYALEEVSFLVDLAVKIRNGEAKDDYS